MAERDAGLEGRIQEWYELDAEGVDILDAGGIPSIARLVRAEIARAYKQGQIDMRRLAVEVVIAFYPPCDDPADLSAHEIAKNAAVYGIAEIIPLDRAAPGAPETDAP